MGFISASVAPNHCSNQSLQTKIDIMPMDPVSSDGGICSSGNSSYDGCENGDDDDEDDIICCVCHCAVDYSDPSMFEPSNGKINDVDSGAVIEEENRKSAENL